MFLFIMAVVMHLPTLSQIECSGIWYNLDEANQTAEVVSSKGVKYSGEITIPSTINYNGINYNVQAIGNNAFANCKELLSVKIPNSIISIGHRAFSGSNIETLIIGDKISFIGQAAFADCASLQSINIPNTDHELIIRDMAFANCANLKEVSIGNGLTIIDDFLFSKCSSIESISIPSSVTTIKALAFNGCYSLTSIVLHENITSVVGNAFEKCSNLKELTIEDGNNELSFENPYTLSNINCFSTCPLETIYIGRDLSYDDKTTLFKGLETLKSVKFGDKIELINNNLFYECENLETVDFSNSITDIGYGAFGVCRKLSNISLGDGITTINDAAFSGCSLQYIFIPNSVKNIGCSAFSCSDAIIIIEDGDEPLFLNNEGNNSKYAFSGSYKKVYLGRDVELFPSFYSNDRLNEHPFELIISKTVTEIYSNTLGGLNLSGISNLVIEYSDTPLIFKECKYLDYSSYRYRTVLPFNNISIDSVFLDREIIAKGISDEDINKSPFGGATSLSSLVVGNNVSQIEKYGFTDSKLSSLTIPSNVMNIGISAFSNCSDLSKLTIEDGIETLDFENDVFYGTPLDSVYIGRNIGFTNNNSPFKYRKEGLKSLKFGNYVTEISDKEFSGLKGLTSIELPNSIKIIGAQAFYGCEGLTEITIPGSVEQIYEQAFDLCKNIKKVTFADGTEKLAFNTSSPSILNNAFTNSPIEEIYLGRNFIFNNNSPLSLFETLSSLTLGEFVTNISERSFIGCPNLKDVTSYSKVVPTTNGNVFTPSYLPTAVLHVPYALYDDYKLAKVWKDFGKIVNFEGLYNLIYLVDGVEYKKYTIEQGTTIIAESEPEKEGYTFSGWSEIPNIMPEHDVTVTGTFAANKYSLTYVVDGEKYKSYEIEYSATITPETEPIKEGYTFSGWSEIPKTMPAHDLTVTGSFSINKYKLIYILDGEEYKSYQVEYGAAITSEPEPTKEGYSFSGWEGEPKTMPANDVTVFGTFKVNMYKLTYIVDGQTYKTCNMEYGADITPEAEPIKEGYTFSGWSWIPSTMPAEDVIVTGSFFINKFKLTYIVDGEPYKTYEVEFDATITPEKDPTKEGFTFSGWSEIPDKMPAYDVTVTGSFTINKYKLIYLVDNEEYKTYELDYGSTITPEGYPTKNGYTFSGWEGEPKTMPAHDVTVTGSFNPNIYILTYIIDGEVYKSYEVLCDALITPEEEPTKEGYTFSGWSWIPTKMPSEDVTITGSFIINKYKLTYIVDGEPYKTYEVEFDATITPENEPTKEGFTFSGWSEIPDKMPASDVTVIGSFTINKYKLIYIVDNEEYKTYEFDYGSAITPEEEPMKEGYTFSGWSWIPTKMPAEDVIVTGKFTINKYKLTYEVDGEEYKTYEVEYGAAIITEAEPTKEGYTFSGWSETPETMPAHDVTVNGTFSINSYTLTYMIDEEVYKNVVYEYGAMITPEPQPEGDYFSFEWVGIPETMPAHDVTVTAVYETGIAEIMMMAQQGQLRIYTPNGKKLDKLQKGLNIVVMKGGVTKKVVVK